MRLIRDPLTKNAILLAVVCTILTSILHDNLQSCRECFRQLSVELNVSRQLPSYQKKYCFFKYERQHAKNVIHVLKNLGYRGAPDSPNWDYMFTWELPQEIQSEMMHLKPHQMINWFMAAGTTVDTPYHLIKIKLALAHRDEPFIAPVYVLPTDQEKLIEFLKENPEERVVSKSFYHRGVRIVNSTEVEALASEHFVQKFISNPLLVGGHKFELGVYVIITSVDPLRVYIYNGDIALRFCPKQYHPFDPADVDRYVVADYYRPIWDMVDLRKQYYTGFGQRISLITYFQSIGVDITPIFGRLEEIIAKIMLRVPPAGRNLQNFAELQRCDFLIDDQLNIFVLECNFIPNLASTGFPQNQLLFEQIVYNVFSLSGVAANFRKNSLALTLEEANILASDSDISVYPDICATEECIAPSSCLNETCSVCNKCLTIEKKNMLKKAYREHVNRMNCKRIWPPAMDPKNQVVPEMVYNLSENNQMMYKWFMGKCLSDDSWCQ